MTSTCWDVIIVGGGPSGAGLAAHLARDGWEVLLLDRAEFPRSKPCGECFSPPVRGLLLDLGVYESVLSAGAATFTGTRLHFPGGITLEGRYQAARHPWAKHGGLSLPRHVLDALLWRNAGSRGACTRAGVRVRGLLRSTEGTITGVHTDAGDFKARLVVGADGGHSRVAREMGVVRPIKRLQKIAFVSHYQTEGPATTAPVELHVGGETRDHVVCGLGQGPNGTANLTCEVPETEARAIASVGAAVYLDDLLQTRFPSVAHRVRRWQQIDLRTCGTFGHRTTTPVTDGALLVGDAADYIDPFTGEGVYFALRGAEIAAGVITSALRRGDTSTSGLVPYTRARRAELAPKYALCELIEQMIHCDPLVRTLGPFLQRQPGLMNLLLEATGDMTAPRDLLSAARLWHVLRGGASEKRADGVHTPK